MNVFSDCINLDKQRIAKAFVTSMTHEDMVELQVVGNLFFSTRQTLTDKTAPTLTMATFSDGTHLGLRIGDRSIGVEFRQNADNMYFSLYSITVTRHAAHDDEQDDSKRTFIRPQAVKTSMPGRLLGRVFNQQAPDISPKRLQATIAAFTHAYDRLREGKPIKADQLAPAFSFDEPAYVPVLGADRVSAMRMAKLRRRQDKQQHAIN